MESEPQTRCEKKGKGNKGNKDKGKNVYSAKHVRLMVAASAPKAVPVPKKK